MTIQSVIEFKELGKSWERKLPATPTQILVQDSVIVSICLLLKEYENLIADLQRDTW